MAQIARGARPSPNIWHHPEIYEVENRAVDPGGVIEATMRSVRDWAGKNVLDLGCGTGFHLPRFAASAASVLGVEPHGALAELARQRTRELTSVRVLAGSAQEIPLPDHWVDIVHARWAYFFGPGCEPGLAELARVVRPGGVAFIIDNDATRSTFGRWFSRAHPEYDALKVDEFFSRHGWRALRREMRWRFENRADFEAVVGIEFAPDQAALILAEHGGADGTGAVAAIDDAAAGPAVEVDYAITIRVRDF